MHTGTYRYQRFNAHKTSNPDLKTILSVTDDGTGCDLSHAPDRYLFVQSTVPFLRDHNFDGMDINFEITEEEFGFRDDFTALLQVGDGLGLQIFVKSKEDVTL